MGYKEFFDNLLIILFEYLFVNSKWGSYITYLFFKVYNCFWFKDNYIEDDE